MFGNLIESGSHAADLKRKGRFFLGTIAFYCLLVVVTGVGSIYAYNAKLDDPTNELEVTLMRFPPVEARAEPEHRQATRPASGQSREFQPATRTTISVMNPGLTQFAPANARDIDPHTPVVIGDFDRDPINLGGPVGPATPGGPGNGIDEVGPAVRVTETPPPPRAVPTPAPQRPTGPVHLPSEIISSKTLSKPAPPYPLIAKQTRTQGTVVVQIVIDEQGHVISAKALSGNPLLQAAAVQAANQAHFTPTFLGGQAVKVTGSITYNFVLN
ncbi:MAG TPA: energy transducer TonB [Pyrinomonadaceae bacterium]|nr:energy transducer TonB [Pyrinomonadaceae bacterium]